MNGVPAAAWMNGDVVDPTQLTIPLMSNAVFRGTSVFDVMPVAAIDGVPHAIGLEAHLERLIESARQMGLDHGFELGDLADAVRSIASALDSPLIVRTVIANGGGSGASSDPDVITAMTIEAWQRPTASSMRLDTATAKIPAEIIPPHIKVAAIYAAGLRAEDAAIAAGYDGIVNVSAAGRFLEGVSASVGLVIDGTVCLPSHADVLGSVTRRLAEDVATLADIEVVVGDLTLTDVERSSGGFIASSTKMVVPLAQIGSVDLDAEDTVVAAICDGVDDVIAGDHGLSATWLTPLVGPGV